MSTPSERCELHAAKRYLPYEEHEGWRAFCDPANPACPQANYAVLKSAEGITPQESLDAVEAWYKAKNVPFHLEQAPDSAPFEALEPLLARRGYEVESREVWRLMHCLQPSPLLLAHACSPQPAAVPLEGPAAALLREYAGGGEQALMLANRRLAAGGKAFVACNRADIPVSICIGEGYGSAFRFTDVFTAESQRKKGYGAAVVLAMLRFAADPERGYEDIFLYVEDGAARRLYEKAGFRGMRARQWCARKKTPLGPRPGEA